MDFWREREHPAINVLCYRCSGRSTELDQGHWYLPLRLDTFPGQACVLAGMNQAMGSGFAAGTRCPLRIARLRRVCSWEIRRVEPVIPENSFTFTGTVDLENSSWT